MFVVNAGLIETDLFYCCLRGRVVWCFEKWDKARLFGIMLHVKQDLSHCRILQKELFRTKNKVRERKESLTSAKKTIQVSNFHNAAETDVNLTGREQVLIQKSRCLFFDGKTVHNLRKYF